MSAKPTNGRKKASAKKQPDKKAVKRTGLPTDQPRQYTLSEIGIIVGIVGTTSAGAYFLGSDASQRASHKEIVSLMNEKGRLEAEVASCAQGDSDPIVINNHFNNTTEDDSDNIAKLTAESEATE